jgi:hypothetical protein
MKKNYIVKHVAQLGDTRIYVIFVETRDCKIDDEYVNLIHLAQERVQWPSFLERGGNLMTRGITIICCRKTVHNVADQSLSAQFTVAYTSSSPPIEASSIDRTQQIRFT